MRPLIVTRLLLLPDFCADLTNAAYRKVPAASLAALVPVTRVGSAM